MNDKARRYRYEKYFWVANVVAAVIVFTFFGALWERISTFYLVIVSIYALVITAGGAEQAGEAAASAAESSESDADNSDAS